MPAQSALIIPVPEAEPLVEKFRARYDPSAEVGVPAHVTVLYPFKQIQNLDQPTIATLTEVFGTFPCFLGRLATIRRFPGVIYLAPEPVADFKGLIDTVTARFPDTTPYDGKYAEVIPHLTVAQIDAPVILERVAAEFEASIKGQLPLPVSITEVTLITNETGRWEEIQRFALGNPSIK